MGVKYYQVYKKYVSYGLVSVFAAVMSVVVITACSEKARAKLNLIFKDAPRSGVVAKINGQEITEEKLIGNDKMDFYEVEERLYRMKMERLNRLLVDELVGPQAQAAKMSLEDYISKKITGGEIKISDADYKKFVAEKHIPDSQINPQIKEKILNYMQTSRKQDILNDYVAKLTEKNPVEVYIKKPRFQVAVEVGQGPIFGNDKAPITIVEFSDFQCPFCSRAADTVSELKKKYGGKIRLAFRHYPLPMHGQAKPTAEASMCVNEQGADKFWKFHDIVFKNQDKLDPANLEKFAKQAGADTKKYGECVKANKYTAMVQKDMEYGEKIGVKSTPTFFVNGQLVSGAVPIETFSELIDDELAQKKTN